MFHINENGFYNHIRNDKVNYNERVPGIGDVIQFWADVWENPAQHNSEPMWLVEDDANCNGLEVMTVIVATAQDICEATYYTHFVPNVWYKKFTSIHGGMLQCGTIRLPAVTEIHYKRGDLSSTQRPQYGQLSQVYANNVPF